MPNSYSLVTAVVHLSRDTNTSTDVRNNIIIEKRVRKCRSSLKMAYDVQMKERTLIL